MLPDLLCFSSTTVIFALRLVTPNMFWASILPIMFASVNMAHEVCIEAHIGKPVNRTIPECKKGSMTPTLTKGIQELICKDLECIRTFKATFICNKYYNLYIPSVSKNNISEYWLVCGKDQIKIVLSGGCPPLETSDTPERNHHKQFNITQGCPPLETSDTPERNHHKQFNITQGDRTTSDESDSSTMPPGFIVMIVIGTIGIIGTIIGCCVLKHRYPRVWNNICSQRMVRRHRDQETDQHSYELSPLNNCNAEARISIEQKH
ncbi:uncharacterized protein LOC122544207 isoform X4 [Chiloscyllium plagiosum]|uniref:uncharacterized protein LOC122544207 isoform X4 n=1 Tax=Chiloscyllium plagiosum TaxID=36176 RepID=UPI001CB86B7B|nr:uncharacterized protein LOC122544207 isoform X4 [Chiloscyllium plagiosum]